MQFAVAKDRTTLVACAPGAKAFCRTCEAAVQAKCGRINIWHWAHINGPDCDSWSEPTSEWHLRWQDYLLGLGADIEVPIQKEGKLHRADAVLGDGTVVELQHSALSVDEIEQRENFYQQMIWVFDARAAYDDDRLQLRDRGKFHSFRWKQTRKSIGYAEKPVRLDLGDGWIFRLKLMHPERPCGGWGYKKYVEELDRSSE